MTETPLSKPEREVVARTCPVCACTYQADAVRLRFGRQTTCSRSCSYKLRGAGLSASVALRCGVCGKEFKRTASTRKKAKHGASFCSRSCHYLARSLGILPRICAAPYFVTPEGREAQQKARKRAVQTRKDRGNYRHSDATRKKLAEATAKNIASGKIGCVSKIEDVVAQELDAARVVYRRQVAIRCPLSGRFFACVDFLVGERVVLEVNGTFRHADRRFYDHSKLAPAQTRTVERYGRKVDALRQAGFQLVEIWEADLAKSPKRAVSEALRRIVG